MKKVELLSPVGDFECLRAAVQNGANSIYLGASSFSARAKAKNFNLEELKNAVQYAKLRNVSVNLTLNTLIKNNEFDDAVKLAVDAYNLGVDAIIVQDLGLAKYLLRNYPEIPIHASTQMTVHNLEGVKQLENLGFSRVVLARELSIDQIEYIRKNTSIELEVFVHGALCISYSGQCLLSSMIGGRSGNRGLCAQPCRLPYELCTSDDEILDKGYILSPKDTCAIEYLPELIKLGIDSFKIEGRMKTPAYVATVTKIYRKYIDFILENIETDNNTLKEIIIKKLEEPNENTGLSDKEELAQVFNRGGFGSGHFSPSPNKKLIYKEKPNNIGIYIGKIHNFNPNKGHITLKLESNVSIGDRISIRDNLYTISELMINNKNFETVEKGNIVKIGRMKGSLAVNDKIFRIESSKLQKTILPTYQENKEFKKIPLNGKITIKKGVPVELSISANEGFYEGIHFTVTSEIIPEESIHRPLQKDNVIKQICKTGSTEFTFKDLEVDLDDNLFVPKISNLNELRRLALNQLENIVIEKYTHNLEFKSNLERTNFSNNISLDNTNNNLSVLLNILDEQMDYTKLKNINNIYLPLKFFTILSYKNVVSKITNQFSTYIYMPHILEDKKLENLKEALDKILNNFNIKGFVVSHISQLPLLKNFGLELIGNFSLNVYNTESIETLKQYKLNKISISPELDISEITDIINNTNFNSEIIVYGKLPLMTNHYCYLGKSNKCYSECDRKCDSHMHFYLKDRKNLKFLILPDSSCTITTIFNSKITSIKSNDLPCNSIRIDISDEKSDEIQNIIDTVLNGERFEGNDYTNGKF